MRRFQIWLLQFALSWIERTMRRERGMAVVIVLHCIGKYSGSGRRRRRRMWYLRKLLDVSRLNNRLRNTTVDRKYGGELTEEI